MNWADLPFQPTRRVLRQFAAACLVILLACAAPQRGNHGAAIVLGALALGVGGLGLLAPAALRWLYVGCMVVAFPLGWLVSQAVLALLFYGLITPLALLFRLRRRDPLRRARPPECASYWIAKPPPPELRRYFRQY